MSALSAVRIAYETLRSRAFGTITTSYLAIGTSFSNPARMIKITNSTDRDMLISYNGIDDMDIVPSASAMVLDYGTNRSSSGSVAEQPAGTIVYAKSATTNPTSGSVYVTVIYLSEV